MNPSTPESFRDRLSMIAPDGNRLKIYAAEVKGRFRRWRNITQFVLIIFFMVLPWTKINSVQTVLLDLPRRQFALFGLVFQAHDGPLLFLIFGSLAVGLAFLTAVWGRVWCGWACPQTVFLDGVFRRIEFLFEGNHLQRRALDKAEMSANKFFRKFGKWLAFAGVSALLTHSFLAYFVGSDRLIQMITTHPSENWTPFVFILFSTAIILFNFGWFREQFCIVMCPYGRFQSVLLDANSVTVTYDEARGEPRKSKAMTAPNAKKGDCVDCGRCVAVCPTGIDIRNGLQMECIGCTACIDACDDIMQKVKKPTGLIRYDSLSPRSTPWYRRARPVAYAVVLMMMLTGLAVAVGTREALSAQLLRGLEAPYSLSVDETGKSVILNHLRLHLHSQIQQPQQVRLELTPEDTALGLRLKTAETSWNVQPHDQKEVHIFVSAPKNVIYGSRPIELRLVTGDGAQVQIKKLKGVLLGPY